MGAVAKRIGLVVIVFDLLVGAAAAAVLHHGTSSPANSGRMSAVRLEQIAGASKGSAHTSCSADPTGGFDYYCISSDGSRALYDVSARAITQRSELPSYR
jgi:hypothetical protein